jgi:hypothetical protein
MSGSWLRKHISTWSATTYARAWPSSSRQLPTASSSWDIFLPVESRRGSMTPASGDVSPPRIGLKPKDARAASTWPRKLQTRCPSPAQEAQRSSRPFWATTSSYIYRSTSCHSWAARYASWSPRPVSRAAASSSRAWIWARASTRAFCSHSRLASRWSRLVSWVLRTSSSHQRVMSSNSSCSCSSPSSFSTSHFRWLT